MAKHFHKFKRNLIVLGIGLLAACAQVRAEPLADFEGIAARCRQAFEQRPVTEVVYAEAANAWVKRSYAPAELSYSARKTSSTVSPFVARIEITEVAAARRGDDEDSARALDVSMDGNLIRSVRSINFAYQDNVWTVIGGTAGMEVKLDANDAFSLVSKNKLSRDAVVGSKGPMAVCVGASHY